MKAACLLTSALLVYGNSPANAVDLTAVSRTITAEPTYQTQPKYGLLVFGPEAATRVWLVHDGETLYADVNGDGDLTDPAERFTAHELSDVDDGTFRFDVGEIHEGELLHTSLSVRTMNLQHLAQNSRSDVREVLAKDPQARFYGLGIHLEMPGHRGRGIDGRVEHLVSPIDTGGLLMFADTPEEAPIIHFGGPWQITLFGGATLTAGRQTEVFLGLGTPGLGAGATAFAAYQDLVPAGKFPKLHVTLPGGDENTIEYVLRERCCTVNFHGGVRLPEDAPPGEATVRITLNDWFGGFAAPTTHKVAVVKPKVEIALQPVSPRLRASLMHPSREGDLVGVRYSPDGSRIIAGDYPGGTIQLWNVETGDVLTTIEAGHELRGSLDYFHLTPDWQSVYVSRRKRELTRVELDGKELTRWEFDGDVRCWNLSTGELRCRMQHSPPRNIITMALSPDGKYILTGDEIPGEYEGHPTRALTLWDVEKGTAQGEFRDVQAHCVFSADSRRFGVCQQSEDFSNSVVEVFDIETGQRTMSAPITEQPAQATVMDFASEGTLLIGRVTTTPNPRDRTSFQSWLKFWETTSGEEVGSIKAKGKGELFSWPATLSPDGRTYAVGNQRGARAELYLIDLNSRQISHTVDLGEASMVRAQVFSLDGRWIAATTQHLPENMSAYTTAEDLPQPRIHLIQAATGQVRETIVAPQSFIGSLCFSPDGQTLASSGPGRVLLWDLSTPPGELTER